MTLFILGFVTGVGVTALVVWFIYEMLASEGIDSKHQ